MHPPRFSYGSGPAPSPPQPSPSNAAPRAFQTDRLYSPSQPTRSDARQQHSTGRSSGAPPHPGMTHTTPITTTAPATVIAASTPPLTFRSAPFRPSTADSRDRFTLSGTRPENGMASPLNHYDYSRAGTSNNSNSNSSGAGWARRGDEVHGGSRPHERFAAEADAMPWTTKATTLLPTLSRLSPYTRNPAPTSTSANTTNTASAGSVHRASARANSTTPCSTAAAGPASLLPPSTESALHYGSGGRAVSLPQNTSAVPPSPPPPAPSISGSEAWPSSRFQDELPAALPGHFDEGPRVSRPPSSGAAAAAVAAARPRGPAVAAVPTAAQLQLSHFAVRELDLQAVDTAAGHVLLRGTFGDATDVFSTDAVWPTPEQNWKRNRQQSDAAQTFTAVWPETTVGEVVHLPFAPSHPPPTPQQQQSDAPSRTFVCECYVTHTAPHAPPAKRSEMFVGRSQVAVEELVEAASAAATATSPSALQAMAGVPAEVVLREDGGAVVGRLCFAVTLLPLPSRTVRLLNVAVLPDPMRTEEEEEEAEREGASAARHYRETDNINRSGSRQRSAVYEGELGLCLRPPTISASMADGPSSGSSITTADFRTPAAVRWTALAPFSFCEAPIKSPNEDAEDLNDEQQQQQKHPHQAHRQQATPLVVGELYYCPPRQLTASQSRSSSMLSTAAAHAPVLLGTFSIPPPHSAASGSTTATPYASSTPGSLRAYRATPRRGGLASYSFQVPLRTSAEGGRWMAMGDCWVRGVVETWVEEADAEALAAVLASTPSAVLSSGPSTPPAASTSVNLAGAAHPPSQAATGARGGAAELLASSPSLTTSRSVTVNSGSFQQPPAQPQSCSQQEAREPTSLHHTPSRPTTQSANYSTSRSAVSLRLPTQLTPTPPPPSTTQPSALTTDQTPQEDVALQRVRERQEALIHRVEYRLSEVREQRQRLAAEMAANDAAAAAEEGAILEEFGVVEAQQGEAEAACREATAQLVELEQLHADRAADHDAYLAEQARALDDVARERAEAMELRAQLEALQAQMRAHMAAEQQRYAARVEHTRAAMQRVEANTRWLTEVEARIAAAESAPS